VRRDRLVLVGLAVAAATVAQAAPAKTSRLTPDGWGAYRIGMGEADLGKLGVKIPPVDEVNTFACRQMRAPGAGDIVLMTQDGKLTRLSIGQESRLKTDRGLGVGAPAAVVRKGYGKALQETRHTYQDPPAVYLTYRPKPGGNGVRYEVNQDGRVGMIHVGGPSIEYVEGCL
jgi:hypothetical protein